MSLYLKYRPQDFTNLEWQKFIKETLQKALKEDKIVGAYLLCWPRWTWKTTTARLLAKTMNCLDKQDWNPCLKCNICKDFIEERLVDIIEIDAASNTWVDNIRALIEKAQFRPTSTKYKVYIIDEVHMLSKWAFNALLKILEEPPTFVKFILATTETHKVPETIISRCQRYDFRRISPQDITKRLEYICKKEKITIDEKSMDYIVQNSGWWLRNAISLLEQLSTSWKIIYKEVIESLWIVKKSLYEDFLTNLLNGDKKVLEQIDEINASWKNIKLFFKWLIFFTKDSILKDIKKSKNVVTKLKILEILDETYTRTKTSLDENITFLVWILKIINREEIKKSETLSLNKISQNNSTESSNTLKQSIKPKEDKSTEGFNPLNSIGVKTEEINHWDIEDIFWDNTERTPATESLPEIKENSWSFDKKDFLSKVKEAWWNAWLKMSLLAADIWINNNNCIIKFKTPFALNSSNNNDNLAYMANALSNMWYVWTQITLK